MKIQLKRSNQLEGGSAKKPTSGQMEYGELAVNYNRDDPAIFLKDSTDQIVRINQPPTPPTPPANNGQININAGDGLIASGQNASANQPNNTTRVISARAGNNTIIVDSTGIKVNVDSLPDTPIPIASTEQQGIVELATTDEVAAGTDTVRAVTPKGLKPQLDLKLNLSGGSMSGKLTLDGAPQTNNHAANKKYVDDLVAGGVNPNIPYATETQPGVIELATRQETAAGIDHTRAVHPEGLKSVTDSLYASLSSAIDLKAPINNPILTGVPQAPTPTITTDNTQIATTRFVKDVVIDAIGNIDVTIPISSTTQQGIIETATTAEAAAGLDNERAVTPAGVYSAIVNNVSSTEQKGIIETATEVETIDGTDNERATTPLGVHYAIWNRLPDGPPDQPARLQWDQNTGLWFPVATTDLVTNFAPFGLNVVFDLEWNNQDNFETDAIGATVTIPVPAGANRFTISSRARASLEALKTIQLSASNDYLSYAVNECGYGMSIVSGADFNDADGNPVVRRGATTSLMMPPTRFPHQFQSNYMSRFDTGRIDDGATQIVMNIVGTSGFMTTDALFGNDAYKLRIYAFQAIFQFYVDESV